jgi:hypothetical protein
MGDTFSFFVLNDGTIFHGVFRSSTTAINDKNVAVFWSHLARTNITTATDHALFAYYRSTGEMVIIGQERKTILAGCCLRYPIDIGFRGGGGTAGGHSSGLNNQNQVIFRLAHTGGQSLIDPGDVVPVAYGDWTALEGLTAQNNGFGEDPIKTESLET